jgi:hypothetical protein
MNEELAQPPNERTSLANIESLFKDIAKRLPTPKKADKDYKELEKCYDKAVDLWDNVAYQYRVGDEDSIKIAEENLENEREINCL